MPRPEHPEYDHLIKLLLIGDSGVGKSCLLLRYSEDSFTGSFIATIGIDFKVKMVDLDGKKCKLQIWDTAGQERFRTITNAYFRNAMGIILVFSVTDESSFTNVRHWMDNIDQHADDGVAKILLGNKCDAEPAARKVSAERAEALAKEYGLTYVETSAKMDINVGKAFTTIARDIKRSKEAAGGAAGGGGAGRVDVGGAATPSIRSKCC